MNIAFQQGIEIIERLEENGHEAYFVGGSVRDTLMDRVIGDIDIATSATPEEIQSIFPKTVDVGAEHGTIIVLTPDEESYEVTTFRTDGNYTDNRHPDEVIFVKSLEEDLKRRDFTMNAIAMNKHGKIIDPFDGEKDINRKVIRTVGKAMDRFREDALRMLRAVRFASQLSYSLEATTFLGIQADKALLENVSIERKTIEMEKLLVGQGVKFGLELLVTTGLHSFLPQFDGKEGQLLKLGDVPLHRLKTRSAIWSVLAYGLKIDKAEVVDFLVSWKLPKKIVKSVAENLLLMEKIQHLGWQREFVYRAGLERSLEAHEVMVVLGLDEDTSKKKVYDLYENLPIYSLKDMVFDGHDLMELAGGKRGKWISEILSDMEMALIHEETKNERAALKEWVYNWLQKYDRDY
ncbi:CCA tRNA nucleotidyltransferase [Sutcliffiella horikoshii]|uniref:CCA-adding enzyme n=1 Tax=Sutcliffiella horikoshii TaxID=79883 RepID=A0AA95B6K6_9BACI|nr:CCA tRNA nucleotidyltransferase [Sutcliffiella horikoshii]TYS58224.1 CCA tRNA nucleotidyltransferase [Sutcliffiella horikoshii]